MRLVLAIIAALCVGTPQFASADTLVKTVNYHTQYHQIAPGVSVGEYVGRMTLRYYDSGIVNGTYRDESGGRLITLTGGANGTKIWLSFGGSGRRTFSGTIEKGGALRGTLTGSRTVVQYQFVATPL